MDRQVLTRFLKFFMRFIKKETKELYFSLEMRRPQNLEEKEHLKKLHLSP